MIKTKKMSELFIFVYAKDGKISVLSNEDARTLHNDLINNGWAHTETLNPCAFIEYLHNESEDVNAQIKSLSVNLVL